MAVNCSDAATIARQVVRAAQGFEAQAPEDTAGRPEASAEELPLRRTTCFCKAVVTQVRGDPAAASFCHCSVCRSLSGAPFVASAIFLPERVQIGDGEGGSADLVELQTSKQVTRLRCKRCFAPVCAKLGRRFLALPLTGFAPLPAGWKPTHHLRFGKF
ncbi:unnamed protein product [Effrenium voratum]|uniref:CENP-V/GFA domain-containing protein n=1 Tax=Effrenium voratum TaxID=2562239 RepID=A0AA36N8M2_9DINO|nr:unnamed protein product [Effrenium voratum]